MQGVPADILDRYTVYSKETAEAMAAACAKTYQADIGIGVTGTMGNIDPANPDAAAAQWSKIRSSCRARWLEKTASSTAWSPTRTS